MIGDRGRRHLDELCALCTNGDIGRAIDLAFEHFAHGGHDEATLAVLRAAVDACDSTGRLRKRLSELEATLE